MKPGFYNKKRIENEIFPVLINDGKPLSRGVRICRCTIYQKFFSIVQNIVQIFVLFATHNYILYLLVMIFCNIMTNICISMKADHMYPWLKQGDKLLPDKAERMAIYKNTLAMSMHKLGTVCVNSTDNILMSALVSLGSVGIYSNYTLITGNVSLFAGLIYNSLTASIGNLGADCEKQKLYDTYRTLNFFCFIITSFSKECASARSRETRA